MPGDIDGIDEDFGYDCELEEGFRVLCCLPDGLSLPVQRGPDGHLVGFLKYENGIVYDTIEPAHCWRWEE